MTPLLILGLLAYAASCGWLADRLLARATWVLRFPREALLLWHALALGLIGSISAVALLLAHDVLEHAALAALAIDRAALHAAYAGPPGTQSQAWNLAAAAALVPATAVAINGYRLWARNRRSRAPLLALAGITRARSSDRASRDHTGEAPTPSVRVVPGSQHFAFCLPARVRGQRNNGLILISQASWDLLDPEERRVVIEHETAHLQRRHHRAVTLAASVTRTIGWSGALRNYQAQVGRLVELDADDCAARVHGTRAVACAVLSLAQRVQQHPGSAQPGIAPQQSSPGALLAMASRGSDGATSVTASPAGERVRRLLASRSSFRSSSRLALALARGVATSTAALPAAAILLPAVVALLA